MQFVRKLTDKRSSAADKKKNVLIYDIDQVKSILIDQKIPSTLNEYFAGKDKYVVPYLDSDCYVDDKPDYGVTDTIFTQFKDNIVKLMSDQDGFDINSVLYAHRHGIDPKHLDKYKISYRAFLVGWKVKYVQLPILIKSKNLNGDCDGLFDINPYKEREQLLACIFACKGKLPGSKIEDKRVLRPLDNTVTFDKFIVQNLTGMEKGIKINVQNAVISVPSPIKTSGATHATPNVHVFDDNIVEMLHILKQERWDDRTSWINIAIVLKNTAGQMYYPTWLKISHTSPKFSSDEDAKRAWDSLSTNTPSDKILTLASLRFWAKADDPDKYHQIVASKNDHRWLHQDLGLCEIARDLCRDKLRLDPDHDRWFAFDDKVGKWRHVRDATAKKTIGDALRNCISSVRTNIALKASRTASIEERNSFESLIEKAAGVIRYVSENRGVRNILGVGSDLFAERGFTQKLDTRKDLIGVRNGVINLKTGDLIEARPEDMICRELDIDYDDKVDIAFIEKMVLDIMADDAEMAKYLQKLLGYGLTGEVNEEIFIWLNGGGRNGKSLILTAIERLMMNSGFYTQGNMGLLVERKVSNPDAERAKISGSRFLVFTELKPDDTVNLDDFKALSGGDGLPCAAKYGAPFTLIPYHLPICATNSMPNLPIVDTATAERVIVIEFPCEFIELAEGEQPSQFRRQRDNDLKRKLEGQLDALLRWMVLGAVSWYNEGGLKRNAPDKVKTFTKRYLLEQDNIESFLNDHCERGLKYRVACADVLTAFNNVNEIKITASTLSQKMQSKNIRRATGRVPGGVTTCYHGFRLKEEDSEDEN